MSDAPVMAGEWAELEEVELMNQCVLFCVSGSSICTTLPSMPITTASMASTAAWPWSLPGSSSRSEPSATGDDNSPSIQNKSIFI